MIFLRAPLMLAVLFYQSLFLALAQIRANKMRSMLTMVGIIIGVASVTAVIAGLTGLRQKVLAEFESIGTNKIFIFPRRPDTGPFRNGNWSQIRFRPEHFDGLLDTCVSLESFTRMLRQSGLIVTKGDRTQEGVSMFGVEPSWTKIENRNVILGRSFSLLDNEKSLPVCLLDTDLRDKLSLPEDCVGQAIMIGSRRFIIIGVLEKKTSGMFGDNEAEKTVFVPFKLMQAALPNWGCWVVATSKRPDLAEEARGEIMYFLRKKRQIRLGDPEPFGVEFVEQYVRQFDRMAALITTIAGGVVSISLLVGGVGIMNIMLVSVSERTREIGLRKAVGARPAVILLQFLVEAVVLCMVGGLIGILGGHLLTRLIASIPNAGLESASIPTWAILLAFGFSAAVGLIFGMFPAIKAARLNPIEALRHE